MIHKISLALAIFSLSLFSSCGKEAPKKISQLRMNIIHEPGTMDPRRGSELIGSTMHFILFEGLMRLNPDGSLTPAQAKSVSISDDRLTYTFSLKETFWSDGSPVVAKDFEMAWKKILTPDFPAANAHLLYPIKNAEKAKRGLVSLPEVGIVSKGDKTLVVTLEKPTPYFLDLISFCVFFPVPYKMDEADPKWALEAGPHFVSNGPFKLAVWKHDNEILFEKNPLYWEANQIYLDKIHVSMVADENTAMHMYEKGDLDIIGMNTSPIPNEVLLKYQKLGLLQTQSTPGTTILCFNVNKFPFSNKNIRKALALAIDRQEIIENLTQLNEEIATGAIPPVLKGNKNRRFFEDNDAKRAKVYFKKGLEELGIAKEAFPDITYSYSISEANHKLAQAIQHQWKEVLGVRVRLQMSTHKVLVDNLGMRNFEIAQSLWMAQYRDPMNIMERFKFKTNVKNYPGWENPEFIRLLDKSAVDLSVEERNKTLEEAESLFIEEMPVIPLYHWKTSFMIHPNLTHEELMPGGAFDCTRLCHKR